MASVFDCLRSGNSQQRDIGHAGIDFCILLFQYHPNEQILETSARTSVDISGD